MRPAIAEGGLVQRAEPGPRVRVLQQRRAGRHEQADRELHRIDVLDQIVLGDEVEQLQVVVRAWSTGVKATKVGRIGMPAVVQDAQRLRDIGARVALLRGGAAPRRSATRPPRRRRRSPARASSGKSSRRSRMCSTLIVASKVTSGNSACSARTIASECSGPFRKSGSPKVMWRAPRCDLRADVRQHDLARHDEEAPAVDRRDGAVAAGMQAAAARLDVARRHRALADAADARSVAAAAALARRARRTAGAPARAPRALARADAGHAQAARPVSSASASASSAASYSPPMIESA